MPKLINLNEDIINPLKNQYKQDRETLNAQQLRLLLDYEMTLNESLQEKYRALSIEAQATAFEERNIDTESLLRVLLKQNQITLENGEYKRQDFEWEENLMLLGLMKKREKTFYIPDEECLDEYTKQLEQQLKEYQELKKIFRKHNITNETMYDGFIRLEETIEKLKGN